MQQYQSRRERVMEQMQQGSLMILYSGESIPSSMDACHPFEANHHFFYLTGIRRENMALMLSRSTDEPKTTLFIEEPVPSMERWTGKRLTKAEAKEISGIDDVRYMDELPSAIGRCVARETVEVMYADCHKNAMNDPDSYNLAKAKQFTAAYPAVALRDIHPAIAALRMIKDEQEIACLREAIALTDSGLRSLLANLTPGEMEYQAQADFEYTVRRMGAEGMSFPTIAGSGINGCMLHYDTNHCRMKEDSLLLLDLGARVKGYCADITRTYPVSGQYTPRQKQYYDIVLKANQAVAQAAKPGVTCRELNDLCKKVLAEGMMALGKIGSEDEIARYYMHGVSHHLGIDTHDCNVPAMAKLQPGMVISNEPGLYVDEEEIGIRIEDDLLITEDGCEVLSAAIPRTTEAIEAIMKKREA